MPRNPFTAGLPHQLDHQLSRAESGTISVFIGTLCKYFMHCSHHPLSLHACVGCARRGVNGQVGSWVCTWIALLGLFTGSLPTWVPTYLCTYLLYQGSYAHAAAWRLSWAAGARSEHCLYGHNTSASAAVEEVTQPPRKTSFKGQIFAAAVVTSRESVRRPGVVGSNRLSHWSVSARGEISMS